ncbi:uncharacterized protein LOC120901632 isoform X2 [Anopheles arabiensis]|uniref:uncharacterized protein LOC120901632 isoform X2 n=1 Tax=Anopheles arabiensis TaxID=7173 RepID=UPI001AAC976D|nr:uncharacterized protein LOC120901632 isoform X2 [Anopheles arabiensis]
MASGDTAAIDTIDVESALSTKNSEFTASSKDQPLELDEYGKFIKDTPGKFIMADGMSGEQSLAPRPHRPKSDKERKIGHRRVGEGGEITYKKIQTTTIMGSIQLGIQHTVGSLASKPRRDLLMMDFWELETISFPPEGSSMTPAHHYSEFKFKIYAPIAFRYFRDLFGIQPDDFMMSMCSAPLRELSNPGASGSIFYLTDDDEFIIKTVQHKEGEFLQKLLPGYYMNLNQNPRTLLPKFFGLYCYQCNSKNVRLVAMNNLLPSYVRMHLKYDLKGSTYKRKANKAERSKSSPTYKDLDFMEQHPNGLFLEAETYSALIKTIQRDCRVLESFKIMDYSLLVGIHNLDLAVKEKQEAAAKARSEGESDYEDAPEADQYMVQEREEQRTTALNRSRSINRQRLVAHSTAMESIQAESEPIDEEDDVPPGGIPARSEKGERLLLFIGIIDILQSYRLRKKLEHTWKSIIHDGDTVSVHRPSFYAQRFQEFMAKTVFKKIPSLDLPEIKGNHRKFRTLVTSYIALKHSPSKRKSLSKAAQRAKNEETDSQPVAGSSHQHHHQNQQFNPTQTHFNQQTTGTPKSDVDTSSSVHTAATITTTSSSSGGAAAGGNGGKAGGLGTRAAGGGGVGGAGSASVTPTNMPPLKKKTTVVKQSVPPPVPPRGSPKFNKASGAGSGRPGGGASGSLPSQSSGHRGRSSAGKRHRSSPRGNGGIGGQGGRSTNATSAPPPQPTKDSRSGVGLDPLQENEAAELQLLPSPNKVLSWLSSNDFRVSENGDILSEDDDSRPAATAAAVSIPKVIAVKRKPLAGPGPTSNVKEATKAFERLSSRNGSGSSVQQMIRNFERTAGTATVARSESMYSRVPSHGTAKELQVPPTAVQRSTRTLPLTIPVIKETLVEDENNNNRLCVTFGGGDREMFIPMAQRLEQDDDLTAHENDQLVLANLKNVVKARREMFNTSPNSTMERKPRASMIVRPTPLPNGAIAQGVERAPTERHTMTQTTTTKGKLTRSVTQGKRQPPAPSRIDPDEIQRKIQEIEAEIRQNEERLNRIPSRRSMRREVAASVKTERAQFQPGPVAHLAPCRNESFLSRLKPKMHRSSMANGMVTGGVDFGPAALVPDDVRYMGQEEKASIIRQIGLPLDENHNLESYLEQFSLEGEFV